MAPPGEYVAASIPAVGTWRVHPDPAALPRLTDDGPGRNRFDDPFGRWPVRYVAEQLRGCLVETMARFRPDPATERLLLEVTGVDADDVDHPEPGEGVSTWLDQQHVGIVHPKDPAARFLDIEDAELLVYLDKHPDVRAALDASGLGTPLSPVHLDAGLVRLGGPVGRPITQALASAVREWLPDVQGISYWSRLDPTERCWAVWGDVPVSVTTFPLSHQDVDHLAAVRSVAALFEISLPEPWS